MRWGVAGNIVVAWMLTHPGRGTIGAACYGLTRMFGTGALGPLVISVAILSVGTAAFARRVQRGTAVSPTEA